MALLASSPSQQSGFASLAWLGDQGVLFQCSDVTVGLTKTSLKGIFSLLCTPPWALHIGLDGNQSTQRTLLSQCTTASSLLCVLDLGPAAHENIQAPQGWCEVIRHTRQCQRPAHGVWSIGKSRQKQATRFLQDEGSIDIRQDEDAWTAVMSLHKLSRARKSLAHHGKELADLVARLKSQPWTFAVLAHDREGHCVASGGFVVLPNSTCVYAFGGQVRSNSSGRASVAMLLAAMEEAKSRGCTTFDFGGSQDVGVDQFYAEFGADVVPMRRWVKAPWWFQKCFPALWSTWTKSSPHF